MSGKVLVIGLDGACWSLIDDWIESGDLPNIKQLKENGLWGDLESCIPPVTCPAWKCYSTGKNPGKLGIYWWSAIDMDNKKIVTANASLFKSKEIWDYLNNVGIKTGIIGMPLTHPPKKVKGYMISGGPDSGTKNYVYPQLLETMLKKINYKVHPASVFAGDIDKEGEEVKDILQVIQQKFEVARKLMKIIPVDFLQITTYYLNGPLQHFFYKEDPVKTAWKVIDNEIGKIKDLFQYVILISDHGTSPLKQNFFINAWLKENNYLYRKRTFRSFLNDLGVNIGSVARVLDMLQIKNFLGRFEIIRKIGLKLPTAFGLIQNIGGESTLDGINWKKTKAVALPQGPIYINKKELSKKEYEELRNEIISGLKTIRSKEGEQIFRGIYKPEEIYKGNYVNKAPDIIVMDSDSFHNLGGLLRTDLFGNSTWKGTNAQQGFILINGPGIKQGKIYDAKIYDVAPTILTLFGCPIPPDIDGQSLINEE